MARSAKGAGAEVLVEVPDERLHGEAHADDRALQRERLHRLTRSEGKEHVRTPVAGDRLRSP